MATKRIIIVGVSGAVVVLMFILGKLADGKDDKKESEEKWRGGRMVLCLGAVADLRAVAAFLTMYLDFPFWSRPVVRKLNSLSAGKVAL